MGKRALHILLLAGLFMQIPMPAWAQTKANGSSVYSFLSLPYSSRLCALGGDNVAIQDGEISMAMQNPALLCNGTDKILELNYAHYMQGTNLGSALFGWNFGRSKIEKHPDEPDKPNYFAVGIHYLDYGKMKYADQYGNLTGGTFTAKDMLIDIMYARQLGPQFTVGVSLKPIMSFYESYSAFALAADVGGHFHTKDSTFQMGLTLRNIGWQLKGFYTEESGQKRESLPFNIELGLAYRFKHAPIRISMTIHNMQRWNLNYELTNQPKDNKNDKIQWYDMMFRHTIFALDIVPKSEKFYLTISYNHRRRAEMNLKDQRSLAGFGLGAGLKIKMVSVGFAISQYTKGNMIYQASLALNINQMMK
ncbi:MAG: type IX secretion system protein PorQ [Paludibacteraceae bacterium]|nr:type IX secretion system protein PorQ [Paludibacteraceae bacterium]